MKITNISRKKLRSLIVKLDSRTQLNPEELEMIDLIKNNGKD